MKISDICQFHPIAIRSQSQSPLSLVVVAGGLLLACLAAGCQEPRSEPRRAETAVAGDAESAEELLHSALATLNNLTAAVDLQLRPQKVVLDASKSRNLKTVYAVITDTPGQPTGRNNLLRVVSNNGRFRVLEVRPGDRIRYYAMQDEHGKMHHVELIVEQVVGDNQLYIYGGLNQPVTDPQRMEIWRYGDEKVRAIRERIERHAVRQQGALVWEPAPDEAGLLQLIDYLNGWMRRVAPDDDWKPDPLIPALVPELRDELGAESLADLGFGSVDARRLQESIWLRDVSRWAAAGAFNDLDVARRLFDWTVCNIRLEGDDWPGGKFNQPWHTLLYGRGTARQRAWIFTQLARQQGLSAVVLAIRNETPDASADAKTADTADFWCAGLLSEGKLYLFDCQLGLPIPGEVAGSVATLTELREKPELLRQLDLEDAPYHIAKNDLSRVVAQVPATPFSLSRRAALLEQQMTGRERVAISTHSGPIRSVLEAGENEEAGALVLGVELWNYPFQSLTARREMTPEDRAEESQQFLVFAAMPELWKARVLYLHGEFVRGTQTQSYLRKARPAATAIKSMEADPVGGRLLRLARAHATYWLGLTAFEQENYGVAEDFLQRRTLEIEASEAWHDGARYLLARGCEAEGNRSQAIEYYLSGDSPQSHGNRLRARRLEAQASSSAKGDANKEPVTEETANDDEHEVAKPAVSPE